MGDATVTPKDEAARVLVEASRAASSLEGWIDHLTKQRNDLDEEIDDCRKKLQALRATEKP